MTYLLTLLLALSPAISLPDPDPLSKLTINLNIDDISKSEEQGLVKEYPGNGKVEEKQYIGGKSQVMGPKMKYYQKRNKERIGERPPYGRRAEMKKSENKSYGRSGKEVAQYYGRKVQRNKNPYYEKGGEESGRSAQGTTILFESVAGAADYRGRSLGYFDEISDRKEDELPVYKQRGGEHKLFHSSGYWYVGEAIIDGGWIRAESNGPLPPTTGWQYHIDGGNWHDDDITLKATINPPEPDGRCNKVRVKSTGPAAEVWADRMGLYVWKGGKDDWLNGRKLYRNVNGKEYLRIYGECEPVPTQWSIAPTKAGTVRGSILSGKGTLCPCDKEAGPSQRLGWDWWRYSQFEDQDDKDFKPDRTITVTCE